MAEFDVTGFDVVVVGAGSAGAVVAARLSEDPDLAVCLLEAGGEPPAASAMPLAVASLQNDPEVDWMYLGDPGGVGKGLVGQTMMVPRGKMLGGSSALNYMAYVRGHPGDFDDWASSGAAGWSYDEVLPYFKKSEDLAPSGDIVVDGDAHGTGGQLGVSVRTPVLEPARQFVTAANDAGFPSGDYNGRDRGGPDGVASLFQTSVRDGKRSDTYSAFLAPALERDNLTIVTHAHALRLVTDDTEGTPRVTGVVYRDADGAEQTVEATREVVLSAGSIGSPQLLMLSGIGPSDELAEHGIDALVDNSHVGKHLKDHLHVALLFPAGEGSGLSMAEVAMGLGPDGLREPAGPLPADPADDDGLPEDLQAVKAEAERQVTEWASTGRGMAGSSLYDAVVFFSTGLGDEHTHDAQIGFLPAGYTPDIWRDVFRVPADEYFADAETQLDPSNKIAMMLANPVQPHSEGQVTLRSADPSDPPVIELNYFDDPHDAKVMVAVMRRCLDIARQWPEPGLGDLMVPPKLAEVHGHSAGDEPSDELLEDMARHYALTVYHETSTCRIGDVVDERLRVKGVEGLRVADASVMPNVVSGNTNAASIMIGEKAAEMIAADLGAALEAVVGT